MTLVLWLWLLQVTASDEDDWVCVVAEDGRSWECGRGADAPEVRSLPAETSEPRRATPPDSTVAQSTTPPVPSQPTIFAPTASVGDPRGQDDTGPPMAGGYALQIADLPSHEELLDFAENFEIDLNRAAEVRVRDAGVERFLLLYGRYDDLSEARGAIPELPPVLRAFKPIVRRLDRLGSTPVPLGDAPRLVEAANPEAQPTPAPRESPPQGSARDATAAEPVETTKSAPPVPPPTEPAEQSEEPKPTSAAQTLPAKQPEALPPQPIGKRVSVRWQGPEAFAAAAGPYTIQLANLPDDAAVARFIAAHELEGALFVVPEASGRRILVLGRHASLGEAQAALARLPTSLIAPWVRRAAPLIQR
ncbi:MAG: hypothetical protein R3200_01070 [Xanthomonadales bacterium]|nr:hypothetical protein [Xanthomonadales bacterium]